MSETEILAQIGRDAMQRERDRTPGEELRTRIEEAHEDFWKLPVWARDKFLVLVSRLALTDPNGADLVKTEAGREQLVGLAGDLLWYVTLPLKWKPYRDPDHEGRQLGAWGFAGNPATTSRRSQERYFDAMLLALDEIVPGRGAGEDIKVAQSSALRWLRREYEVTTKRIEERNRALALESGIDAQRPLVGDQDSGEEIES